MLALYQPVWPALSFILALSALPLAFLVRRLGGATRGRPLPRDWRGEHVVVFAAMLTAIYIALALMAEALEPAAALLGAVPTHTPVGQIAGSLGTLLAQLGWVAWQGLMLVFLVGAALSVVAELRWPQHPLSLLAQMAGWPIVGALLLALVPYDADGLRVLALTITPFLTFGGVRILRRLPARWTRWRAREPAAVTRVSSLPAAMAAALDLPSRPQSVTTALPLASDSLPPT